ncbi:hypothetical protein IX39_03110 [Chryseobacterium formosense]|uniref:Immunity protein 35 domain-containing protein n=1 Tax=Chryseobacterium formosense TaxID=236814 RepID=A0A085Z5F5_9FLAO|nr:hypothetical protein [Chryseobacterium formosense]KFE99668.1 hypothetical protein IX39_03110 [Chryseobacterium formosense]SFT79439.1 hypothetical protein SAMN05421857_3269 [Chryseobacterium formosense]
MQENSKDEYLKIAKEYLLNEYGDIVQIFEDHISETDDTFCFHYQSKKFFETLKFEHQFVGQGPLFILKRSKRIIPYGSATGEKAGLIKIINQLNKERLIRVYYKDYDIWDGKYDLIINKVEDEACGLEDVIIENLVSVLLKHKIWKANQYDSDNPNAYYYTEKELKETLIKSPLILKKPFCKNLEDLLVDLINTNMYLDWTLSEVK